MLDFSVSKTGGINLNTVCMRHLQAGLEALLPGLPLYNLESHCLDEYAYDNLAQQSCEDFARHQASGRSFSA